MGPSAIRAAMGVWFCGLAWAAVAACSSSPAGRLLGMLPGDGEVEDWRRLAPPTLVDSDTELYNQIDGAAPKYIQRGWQATVYATYGQGTTSLQVGIHDMGTSANAETMFNTYLPVSRVALAGLANAVVDLSLAGAYQAMAWRDRYYVEVNVDDRSDAALVSIEAFTAAMLRH